MNKVVLTGRLTSDPDMRGEGTHLCARFTLAVRRTYSDDCDFIRCVAWGKGAEIAENYLGKGRKVGVSGRLHSGKYVNRDGVTVYYTEVVVENFEFLDSRPKVVTEYIERPADKNPFLDDDMPF